MKFFYLISLLCILPFVTFSQTLNQNFWVPNGVVNATASDSNYVYLGGDFTYVGPYTSYGAKISTSSNFPDLNFPKVNDVVCASIPDGNGGWYIGGNFTKVGDIDRGRLAHINSDGSVDLTWNPNADSTVLTLALGNDGIYAGGSFSSIQGQSAIFAAKLNFTDGAADPNWKPNPSNSILSIAVSGNDIYAAGVFSTIGGQTRNYLAKLNNSNGDADVNWNPNPNSYITTIIANGTDIYVGGPLFTAIGGLTRSHIAKLNNTNGNADSNWNDNFGPTVNCIALIGNSVYVGGSTGLFKLNNITGSPDPSWVNNFSVVYSITADSSNLYVGGFSGWLINGALPICAAKVNASTGAIDQSSIAYAGKNIKTIALSGSNLFIGGDFFSIGGKPINCLARLNSSTGILDNNWSPNPQEAAQPDGRVYSIIVDGSNIYAGGYFNFIGGQSRAGIAKLNYTNGNADESWNVDDPNNSGAITTLTKSGNYLYAGGYAYLAKINCSNAQVDSHLQPVINHYVMSIAIKDNDIYAGGLFTSVNGQTRNYLAKFNGTDGTLDANWNPNANDRVRSLVTADSSIYIGGEFTVAGGFARSHLAKLNTTNGYADGNWNPDVNGIVMSIVPGGNYLYMAGAFSKIYDAPRSRLAAVNISSGSITEWNPPADGGVLSMSLDYAGKTILASGFFKTILNVIHPNFAELSVLHGTFTIPGSVTLLSPLNGAVVGDSVTFSWDQVSPDVNKYLFEISADSNFTGSIVDSSITSTSVLRVLSTGTYWWRVKAHNSLGWGEFSAKRSINVVLTTDIKENSILSREYYIRQNYPNPFNPSTSIDYNLGESGITSLKVYNALGKEVAVLVNGYETAGTHKVSFNASNLSSGVYFYRLVTPKASISRKMIFMK
ncbi:MAG: T9SS type A sorting domain-containing protein [Methanococcaceae archaeon]